MKKLGPLALILLLCINNQLLASPTGADVLAACEESLTNDFEGMSGMMCVWYVTPCDCDYGTDPEVQPVCFPDSKETDTLAREVIEGLRLRPELQSKPAEVASSLILARIYPCE